MNLTPTKHRPLTRQRSSPSLNIGIPPSLPDYFNSTTPPKRLARSRHRIHRGDVSSSASSAAESDSDYTPPATPTQRPRVIIMEPMSVGRPKPGGKRDTLQSRLQAAANLRASKSMDTLIPPVPALPHSLSPLKPRLIQTSPTKVKNDKVVVCVRLVEIRICLTDLRIKPTSSSFGSTAYETTETSISLSDSHPNVVKRGGKAGREDEYSYTFGKTIVCIIFELMADKLLQYPSTTPDLYNAKIAPLVEKAMSGFNTTVFAYGATASGKSYTMVSLHSDLADHRMVHPPNSVLSPVQWMGCLML